MCEMTFPTPCLTPERWIGQSFVASPSLFFSFSAGQVLVGLSKQPMNFVFQLRDVPMVLIIIIIIEHSS